MKRVVFGYEGGFPLEQETLLQIQTAYEEDMLEALFTLWGLDVTQKYKVKVPTNNKEDGWLILPIEIQTRGKGSGNEEKDHIKETKLQLVRLVYKGNGTKIAIKDIRLNDGDLEYAEGNPQKVYEEFIAEISGAGTIDISSFVPITSILALERIISNNSSQINTIKEDYLPINGSKPMTGDLNLGSNQISKLDTNETFTAIIRAADLLLGYSDRRGKEYPDTPLGRALVDGGKVLSVNHEQDWEKTYINGDVYMPNAKEVNSQTPLVIDSDGNVGKNTSSIGSADFSPGMVMMWSGDTNKVPTGWVLCDGRTAINAIKIPDLRGRFVAGYSANDSDYSMGVKKGKDSYTLSESNIPAHTHKLLQLGSAEDSESTRRAGSWEASHDSVTRHDYETTKWGSDSPSAIDNRPKYYVLAFIIYVGNFNKAPIAKIKFDDENDSVSKKTRITAQGDKVVVKLDGSSSDDFDGSVVEYIWEKCFSNNTIQEEWTELAKGENLRTVSYTIPTEINKRYGTHFFRLKVKDNEETLSSYSREFEYEIKSTSSITTSVNPLQVVNFGPFNVDSTRVITINAKPGWRVKENSGNVIINPLSSSTEGQTSVSLTVEAGSFAKIGRITFETTDGLETVIVRWGHDQTIIDGPPRCFDLESDVLMASGRSKKLKNIVVGDELRVYDFISKLSYGNEEFILLNDLMKGVTVKTSKVTDFGTQTVEEYRKITLVNNEILSITPTHPILASRDGEEVAWLLPDDLRAGYFVVNKDGELVEIASKRTVKESLEIGILQLETGDNYFVQNTMVHNAKILRAVARVANKVEAQPIEAVDAIDKL